MARTLIKRGSGVICLDCETESVLIILLQHTQDLGFTQAIENEHLSILVNPSTEVGFKPAPSEKRCDNVEIYCLENLKYSRQILKFPIPNPHFP